MNIVENKIKEIVINGFDKQVIILPRFQPVVVDLDNGFIVGENYDKGEISDYYDWLQDCSLYSPGETVIAITRTTCDCGGSPCEFCYNTGYEKEFVSYIELSSIKDNWHLLRFDDLMYFDYNEYGLKVHASCPLNIDIDILKFPAWFNSWSPTKAEDNPYLFIVPFTSK